MALQLTCPTSTLRHSVPCRRSARKRVAKPFAEWNLGREQALAPYGAADEDLFLPAASDLREGSRSAQGAVVNTPVRPADVPLTLVMTNWNK